ncbi:hypothetical protein K457DRAFT_134739 [Linnemannia elongata AG-77]|uniref:Epidermal growth factor receptor-like transmembrane-juxtamembrane segment domain-containing protein n=1 Tax=Linnemannia elongata AG-77 TaxID=1314771 RepID=A0A197K634_9FUNG|nr:hypothetical protein K457DRAFT_134739 [Linnemannia elongata AG-77]
MAAKNITIPRYTAACLAADEGSGIYLVGSPSPGLIELNFISDLSAKTLDRVGSKLDSSVWAAGAGKACFTYPYPKAANRAIQILQFGSYSTYFSIAYPNGTIEDSSFFRERAFVSPRLFAWSGSLGDYDMFSLVTNYTFPGYSNWAGMRLSFLSTNGNTGSLFGYGLTTFPAADPLLAVGTYTASTGALSSGYTIVFDKANQARAYLTSGSTTAFQGSVESVMTLAPYVTVNMNNIVLSANALGITMAGTAYILDKVNSGNYTVIYSITPGATFELKQVTAKGGAPLFIPSMAGAAYGKQIVTYSVPPSGGDAYFNSFDTVSGTWSGSGLIMIPGDSTTGPDGKSSTPIGAIIGGVVGGLLVIALAVFFFVRRRRQSAEKSTAATQPVKQTSEINKFDGANHGHTQPPVQQIQYDQPPVQYVQYEQPQSPFAQAYQVQYDPNQGQQVQYNLAHTQPDQGYVTYNNQGGYQPPTFVPPPVSQQSSETPMPTPYKLFQPAGVAASDSVGSPMSTTAYSSSSPYVSPSSHRDSVYPPGTPESSHAKPDKTSLPQSPQYVPTAGES